jgi:signal transduction histidine kinase
MSDPDDKRLRRFAAALAHELRRPVMPGLYGLDLDDYDDTVWRRATHPQHTTLQ